MSRYDVNCISVINFSSTHQWIFSFLLDVFFSMYELTTLLSYTNANKFLVSRLYFVLSLRKRILIIFECIRLALCVAVIHCNDDFVYVCACVSCDLGAVELIFD